MCGRSVRRTPALADSVGHFDVQFVLLEETIITGWFVRGCGWLLVVPESFPYIVRCSQWLAPFIYCEGTILGERCSLQEIMRRLLQVEQANPAHARPRLLPDDVVGGAVFQVEGVGAAGDAAKAQHGAGDIAVDGVVFLAHHQ